MSNYERKKKEDLPPSREVEFYLDCIDCDEEVTTGLYFPTEKTFVGKCPAGHVNEVKGLDFL